MEFSAPLMAPSGCLYVSDLDGTLLDAQGRLSVRSRNELLALIDAGVLVTIATARSHCSISQIFQEFPFPLPIVEFNGAFITDYQTGKHWVCHAFAPSLSRQLFDKILEAGLRPFVSSFDGVRDRLHYDEVINPSMSWYESRRRACKDPRLNQTIDLRNTLSEQVVSLTIMAGEVHDLETLREQIKSAHGHEVHCYLYENAYHPGHFWLSLHPMGASKYHAAKQLRDTYAPGRPIVAFGDHLNDLDLLEGAELAVAVANAEPEILRVAHTIIGPHTDESVVRFIREHAALHLASPDEQPADLLPLERIQPGDRT